MKRARTSVQPYPSIFHAAAEHCARGGSEAMVPIDGRCFAYVFPCGWEDHCKIGFSHDPLERIAALHPRWFEFFDLDRGVLVEAESQRDARDLELELRAGLGEYNAPAPLTICRAAGGHTEWFRGAATILHGRILALEDRGYRIHPLGPWLRTSMRGRADLAYEWVVAQLGPAGLCVPTRDASHRQRVCDVLDMFTSMGQDLDARLEPHLPAGYRRRAATGRTV